MVPRKLLCSNFFMVKCYSAFALIFDHQIDNALYFEGIELSCIKWLHAEFICLQIHLSKEFDFIKPIPWVLL